MSRYSVRPVGYTGTVEEIVWTAGLGNGVPVTAYLWGGGGGGGGSDRYSGGAGSGGAGLSVSFSISEGDTLQIAVGGAGQRGSQGWGVASGGTAGAGYLLPSTNGYSGGRGGNSGAAGFSGAGGGGGGATVLFLNGSLLGVAGGGGGGGGGGNYSGGSSAPGWRNYVALPNTNGQNGQDKSGDGGGGGGGGGGYGGGQGGETPGGDLGGYAGYYGNSYTVSGDILPPTNQNPGGSGFPYYSAQRGRGGGPAESGTTGSAVLIFDLGGISVHYNGQFQRAQPLIKYNGSWQSVAATYVKQGNQWQSVVGVFAPTYNYYSNTFGTNSRSYS